METSGISAKAVEPMKLGADESPKTYEKPVKLEMEPDSYEFSTKGEAEEAAPKEDKLGTLAKKAVAGSLAVSATAPQIGKVSTKISNWFTQGLAQMADDFGRTAQALPKAVPASIKYGAMLIGSVTTFLLATKDSDKDGKLDILESVGKLFNPAS